MMWHAWGKTDRESESGTIHPLAHHSMDVAAVFLRMLHLPVIRNRLETAAGTQLTDVDCLRLAALAFLHDIGKLHPGFQAKGWPEKLRRGPVRGHTKESWAFVLLAHQWVEHPFHGTLHQILEWGPAVEPIVAAMFGHHGGPVEPPSNPTMQDWDFPALRHYDWRRESDVMDEALNHWFAGAFESGTRLLPDNPLFHHAIAGYAALADWIGSDTQFFRFENPFSLDYDDIAHSAADLALRGIGLDTSNLAGFEAPTFDKLTGFPEPNPAQAAVGDVGPNARLVILEAETGSGKTEAALWRFTHLFAAGKVSGLYFAVPTRAAAKQLHGRIDNALKRVFGDAVVPEAVLAIPGMLKAGEFKGRRLPHWRVRWDDNTVAAPHRWAAEHATRFLAATVAVGTVDQAMLATLKVKHAHLRGSALSRSLLVIDEVHASDAYMTEVLKRLLDGHLASGGYAMLMSATLGARARVHWTDEVMPESDAAVATPYPAVWVKGEAAPRIPSASGGLKIVYPQTRATMEPSATAGQAIEAAGRGARVLVVRNTVSAAVETWHEVLQAGGGALLLQVAQGPALHHGRFAAEDRAVLDGAVEAALVPDTARPMGGCIVIGTQTLEQSLDIDADLLITDLCPIDVLLQRIGRLHRHESLPRPDGFSKARVSVLLPEGGLDRLCQPPWTFDNGLGAWKGKEGGFNGIYSDVAGLELTRRLIEQRTAWRIPEMNRELVERGTHPECLARVIREKGDNWERYDRDFGGAEAAKAMMAKLNLLDRRKSYGETSDYLRSDELVKTRLGGAGVIVKFAPALQGPFGAPITRIALPAHWSQGLANEDHAELVEQDESVMVFGVGDQLFRYSRAGLEKFP